MPRQTEVLVRFKRRTMHGAPVTGQTCLYDKQMQQEFIQNMYDRDIEGYCLDATDYIPDGSVKMYAMNTMAIANWVTR